MKKFSKSFINAVNIAAEALDLIEITNDRHRQSGTIALSDPVTKCIYTLHTSGYICRTAEYKSAFGVGTTKYSYQLNNTYKEDGSTIRIRMTEWEQLGKLLTSTVSYRKHYSQNRFK